MRVLLLLMLIAGAARADGERPGAFDYYVLSLSWSPGWCAAEGRARGSAQCAPSRRLGWVLHGLWPQGGRGYPSWCRTAERDPSRGQTADMADIMGEAGLAWYEWKKHGRCSGLSASAYFEASREAFEAVVKPEVFTRLEHDVELPARVVEEAFLNANPGLSPAMVTVTCTDGRIDEVRICLDLLLSPRTCGADVARDCQAEDALLDAVR